MNPAVTTHFGSPDTNNCPGHGGVNVTPCRVRFTVRKPGPETVVVKSPQGENGVLSESDDCGGASGMATVAQQGTSDNWTVTAGATAGRCSAVFDYKDNGKLLGSAKLFVNNKI